MTDAPPIAVRAARGTLWLGGLRVFQRGAGFARLLVLTHLLGPEHFGTMGVALLLVEALNACSQTGFQTALIQRKGPVEPYLDAAWTGLAVRGALLCAAVFAAAPAAAAFFGEPAATGIVRAVGVALLLQGIGSVGVVLLERDLDFRRYAVYQLSGTAADLAAAIAAGLYFRDAWAFAAGLLAGETARLVAGYAVRAHWPRPCIDPARLRELFRFGRWMLVTNLLLFAAQQGDDVFVGRVLGAAALGLYQFAWQLAHLAATEVSRVVSQVALPSYARLQGDREALRRAYERVLQGTALCSWPAAALVFALGPDFTRLALPEDWHALAAVVPILALHAGVRAHGATVGPVLVAVGRPQLVSATTLAKCLVLAATLPLFASWWGLRGAALSVLAASLVSNAAAHAVLFRVLDWSPRGLASIAAVPVAATAGMTVCLLALREAAPAGGLFALALHAVLGLAVYAAAAASLSRVGRRPLAVWFQAAYHAFALQRGVPR